MAKDKDKNQCEGCRYLKTKGISPYCRYWKWGFTPKEFRDDTVCRKKRPLSVLRTSPPNGRNNSSDNDMSNNVRGLKEGK